MPTPELTKAQIEALQEIVCHPNRYTKQYVDGGISWAVLDSLNENCLIKINKFTLRCSHTKAGYEAIKEIRGWK
ncbi:MAG: hypothetical protein GY807_20425 [Gammaproteobacteria bacterium]|nr:hypothetical protein [Gammaproteobacteria bacterium]